MTNDEAKAWLEAQGAFVGELNEEGRHLKPRTFRALFWKTPEKPSSESEYFYGRFEGADADSAYLLMKQRFEETGGPAHIARMRRDETCPEDCGTCALKAEAAKQ